MKTTRTRPDIPIIYEDNHLLVIDKPAGVLSQEDHTGDPDVLNLCKKYLKKAYNKPGRCAGFFGDIFEPESCNKFEQE